MRRSIRIFLVTLSIFSVTNCRTRSSGDLSAEEGIATTYRLCDLTIEQLVGMLQRGEITMAQLVAQLSDAMVSMVMAQYNRTTAGTTNALALSYTCGAMNCSAVQVADALGATTPEHQRLTEFIRDFWEGRTAWRIGSNRGLEAVPLANAGQNDMSVVRFRRELATHLEPAIREKPERVGYWSEVLRPAIINANREQMGAILMSTEAIGDAIAAVGRQDATPALQVAEAAVKAIKVSAWVKAAALGMESTYQVYAAQGAPALPQYLTQTNNELNQLPQLYARNTNIVNGTAVDANNFLITLRASVVPLANSVESLRSFGAAVSRQVFVGSGGTVAAENRSAAAGGSLMAAIATASADKSPTEAIEQLRRFNVSIEASALAANATAQQQNGLAQAAAGIAANQVIVSPFARAAEMKSMGVIPENATVNAQSQVIVPGRQGTPQTLPSPVQILLPSPTAAGNVYGFNSPQFATVGTPVGARPR